MSRIPLLNDILGIDTRLAAAGRDSAAHFGFVNTPVFRGSTILADSVEEYESGAMLYSYGRSGTPTSAAFEAAICALDGSATAVACPSGLSAISISVLSCVSAGDHILVADNVYRPARRFFDNTLARFGVSVGYVDPHSIDKLSDAIRPNTRVLYTEIPGALSGEVIDFPKAATIAHEHGLTVLCDNTWATPLFFDAFAHGADMCIQSGTKYLAGHSDVVIGCVSASVTHAARLRDQANEIGTCVGPDDLFLTLRGMRSLALRLRQHQASALTIARWLEARLEVLNVLHPALESHPDHAIWRRDFAGATGLFSVIFAPDTKSKISEMLNSLELFGIGISWGGFESLIIPFDCTASRTATKWEPGGPTVRFSIGLEDPTDLIHDLEQAFKLFRHI